MSDNTQVKKRAVIIGINYVTVPRLRLYGCINDAKFMSSFWQKQGVDVDNILMLTDEVPTNKKRMPTAQNVRKAFRWLLSDATVAEFDLPESQWSNPTGKHHYYIHYSGHGTQVTDYNGDEKDGKDEAICCLNDSCTSYTNIIDDDIRSELAALVPDGDILFGTMDCCHSGTVVDLPFKNDGNSTEITGVSLEKEVYIISGCQDNQTDADAFIDGVSVGATTAAFLAVMRESGSSQYTYSKIIERMNVYRQQHVYHNQRHVFSYCHKGDEGCLFLCARKSPHDTESSQQSL